MAGTIFAGSIRFDPEGAAPAAMGIDAEDRLGRAMHPVLTDFTAQFASAGAAPLADDPCMLVASAALYNRRELMGKLGAEASCPDPGLILAAYRRWGEDCVEHLEGDFSFAIWDRRAERLFCARDHFGVRPFYYVSKDGLLAFASAPGPLLKSGFADLEIDEAVVAELLLGEVGDSTRTPFRDIRRLPPAHRASFDRSGLRIERYWSLDPKSEVGRDWAEAFREIFKASVAARLNGVDQPGALLSGGLDSSSIACVARDQLAGRGETLRTFSLVYPGLPGLCERQHIEAVLAQPGFRPTMIEGDPHPAFLEPAFQGWNNLPYLAPNLASTVRLHSAAAAGGARILLCGHGGDEVVSHAFGRLDDLARARRWADVWTESRAVSDLHGQSRVSTFLKYVARHGGSGLAGRLARRSAMLERLSPRPVVAAVDRKAFLDPDLIRRTDLIERLRATRRLHSTEPEQHLATLTAPLQPYAFEALSRGAELSGVEVRYPFWDKRLVEFCVALPSDQKLAGGWSRLVLRKAMEGILPPRVQWRRDKLDFTPHLVRGMLGNERARIEEILSSADLAGFADRAALTTAWSRIVHDPARAHGSVLQAVWRASAVGSWLAAVRRQRAAAPPPAHARRSAPLEGGGVR